MKIVDSTIFLKQLQRTEVDPFILDLNSSEQITTTILLQLFFASRPVATHAIEYFSIG